MRLTHDLELIKPSSCLIATLYQISIACFNDKLFVIDLNNKTKTRMLGYGAFLYLS